MILRGLPFRAALLAIYKTAERGKKHDYNRSDSSYQKTLPYARKSLTENNHIPKSYFVEYGFQKIGKNFTYPVNEKLSTSAKNNETIEGEINENTNISE